MSSVLLALSQDPTAAIECFAALLTAGYLLRLASAPVSLDTEPADPKLLVPSNGGTKRPTLRDKLLRFFAVGETIVVAKRSLRGQGVRLYFW